MIETMTDLTIRRSVTVAAPPERAFEVFTERMHTWWPLATHSVRGLRDGAPPAELHFEPRPGGRFYEKTGDEECSWGTVLVCEPPHRLVYEWHVNPENPPTEVEVTFTPEDGGTRVDLVHRGWERFPADSPTREGYDSETGWTTVLARFAASAG
jgi:uncharacterized protein YndB with AHSA1/START domain